MLLDQRICCGVGNVYKSEVLWACRLDPRTQLRALGPRTCLVLVETAADSAAGEPRRRRTDAR